jgi:hypothetical protein
MITGSAEVSGSARQPTGELDTVHVRHHPVDDREIGPPRLHHRERVPAVLRLDYVEAVHLEVELDEARDVLVVVDHEDDVGILGLQTQPVRLRTYATGAHAVTPLSPILELWLERIGR